jgi:hypothetical protein
MMSQDLKRFLEMMMCLKHWPEIKLIQVMMKALVVGSQIGTMVWLSFTIFLKGSLYNVKIIWWDGSSTWEPVMNLVRDDPVTLAAYMKKNNLQGMKGWWYPTIKAICKQEQKL